MTVSQQIHHINENNYDDDIMITDIPKGYFPAVTSMIIADGSNEREIRVDLLALEQSPGGTMPVNSGLYIKGVDETMVKVKVYNDSGTEVAENTTSYN